MAAKWPYGCFQIARNSLLLSEMPSVPVQERMCCFWCYLFIKMKFETFFSLWFCSLRFPCLSFSGSYFCYWNMHVQAALIRKRFEGSPCGQGSSEISRGSEMASLKWNHISKAEVNWRWTCQSLCYWRSSWNIRHTDYLCFLCLIIVWKWNHHQAGSWSGRRQRRWAVQSVIW
jgi:hypothetical protein